MAGHGGRREGSGRPRNSVKYEDEIKILNDAIAKDVKKIYDKGMELIEGVMVMSAEGIVYEKPPNARMIVWYLERLAGKPVQSVELTGEGGDPIEVDATVRSQASQELQAWRDQMREALSNSPSAPPTMPTSSTPTA